MPKQKKQVKELPQETKEQIESLSPSDLRELEGDRLTNRIIQLMGNFNLPEKQAEKLFDAILAYAQHEYEDGWESYDEQLQMQIHSIQHQEHDHEDEDEDYVCPDCQAEIDEQEASGEIATSDLVRKPN